MILCDSEIQAAIQNGQIRMNPVPPAEHFSTTSVDLTLGASEFKRWKRPAAGVAVTFDPSQPGSFRSAAAFLEEVPLETDGSVIVPPQQFLLAITQERIELPETSRFAARVEGRSSLARLGLGIHMTAPIIHAGFKGKITLEITNHGTIDIKLRPGMRICQLVIEMVFGTPSTTMKGLFQNQVSVTGSS